MEKNKETKRFDLVEFGSALGREEMKKLMAGSEGGGNCSACLSFASTCYGACDDAFEPHQDLWAYCIETCKAQVDNCLDTCIP